ncbi:MAG TPA: universal stress protein [Ottowia sp.]|uniref:universal stress protein n=1 Tax=Ottowia sp. TaxID=1898956 RepID=UPI002B80CCFB|nr:universal stress protein [Ottowia sp.]HMN21874.1 universal stress protein [Ottowia sp.]
MYKRILVSTDGSELSGKAVNHAIALAAQCGAELVAMTVVPHYPRSYYDGSLPLSNEEVERVEKHWAEGGHKILDTIRDAAQAKGVAASDVVVKSDLVADAIIETAKKQDVDLIVMASHGRKGVSRLLLGSETQQVLTRSEIPVLVLR